MVVNQDHYINRNTSMNPALTSLTSRVRHTGFVMVAARMLVDPPPFRVTFGAVNVATGQARGCLLAANGHPLFPPVGV